MTVDLWDISSDESSCKKDEPKKKRDTRKCIIQAGTNKRTERPLYISSFDDSDELSVSAVPYVFPIKRAEKVMAELDSSESFPKSFYGNFPKDLKMIILEEGLTKTL